MTIPKSGNAVSGTASTSQIYSRDRHHRHRQERAVRLCRRDQCTIVCAVEAQVNPITIFLFLFKTFKALACRGSTKSKTRTEPIFPKNPTRSLSERVFSLPLQEIRPLLIEQAPRSASSFPIEVRQCQLTRAAAQSQYPLLLP